MPNTVSQKRARQRAKKATADGGSHQQALDVIAQGEGHAHWGGKLKSDASRLHDLDARPRIDLLDYDWLDLWPDERPAIVDFVGEALGGYEEADGEVASVLGHMMAHLWFDADHLYVMNPSLHAAISSLTALAVSNRHEAWEESVKFGAVYDRPWQELFVDVLASSASSPQWTLWVATLRRATPAQISGALELVSGKAKWFDTEPRWPFRFVPVSGLSDALLLSAVAESFGDVWPSANDFAVIQEIIAVPGFMGEAIKAAQRSLGAGVRKAAYVTELHHLSRKRMAAITTVLQSSTGAGPPTLVDRYGPLLREAAADPNAVTMMAAWLLDAFAKVDRGREPFSFNPYSLAEGDAMRQATLVLVAIQIEGEKWESADIEGAVHLVEDLLSVISFAGARSAQLVADGVTISHPGVMRLLAAERANPGQSVLFASLNAMDPKTVSRLRQGLASQGAVHLATRALSIFENEALRIAAS